MTHAGVWLVGALAGLFRREVVVAGRVLQARLRNSDSINDAMGALQQLVGLDPSEVGKIGRVSAVDHPRVKQIEVIWINLRSTDIRVTAEQLVEPVDPGHTDRHGEQSRLECFLGCLLRQESGDT